MKDTNTIKLKFQTTLSNFVREGQVIEGHIDKYGKWAEFMGNDGKTHLVDLYLLSDSDYPVIDIEQHRNKILEDLLK
jgi:hypothetical protein